MLYKGNKCSESKISGKFWVRNSWHGETMKRQCSAVLSSEVKAIDCSKELPKWQKDGTSELVEFQDIKC